jgi:putative ABC transport system permease protein
MLLGVVRQALDTMWLHRRWAALTMFGIVWGTASVVLLIGWGVGVHGLLEVGMQKVGKNLVWLLPGRVGEDLSPADERRMLYLEREDVEALRASARRAALVTGELQTWMYARRGATGRNVHVRGVEPVMRQLRGVSLAAGRFLTAEDLRAHRRVTVIGARARERLFGARPAVGRELTLNGQRFEVVGLLGRVGPQLTRDGPDIDEQAWIPLTTAQAMTGEERLSAVLCRATERRHNEELKREVRTILGRRLHVAPTDEEAVFIVSLIDYLATFDTVFAATNGFLFILATTTLAIGGIGVMNMMLVSVNERRREIGLRRAVGALRRHVVGQFLVETLVITLTGGLLGLGLGLGACAALTALPRDVFPIPVIVPEVVVLALLSTIVVGVLSGSVPAWRAATIDPAESLRAE